MGDAVFGTLSQKELIERFSSGGFVALPRFIGGDALGELQFQVDRFIADVLPKLPSEQVFFEDRANPLTLKQIQQMGAHDPWFCDFVETGGFRELAELLLAGPVVAKNLQYFNKPPGIGRPTPPHQDGYYFMLDPCEAITMWLALDEVDEENGCVRYVRGSHASELREHARTQTLGFSQGIVDYPTEEDLKYELACPAQPGDLLVHHAMTVHRADGNRSRTRSRRALGFIFYSERAREDTRRHTEYQRKLAEEMKTQGRI